MNFTTILQQLKAERDRLAKAIEALVGIGGKAPRAGRRGRRPKGRPKATAAPKKRARRTMSAAAKAKLSRLMKQRWAKQKKAGKSRLGA